MKIDRRRFLLGGVACAAIPVVTMADSDNGHDKNLAIAFDQNRCIGCENCIHACRETNDVPEGVTRLNIVRSGPMTDGNERYYRFDRISCVHCENAPCVEVCPTGACFTDEDGVVGVDSNRCVGCQYCIAACPYRVRFVNPVTKAVDKCDFCRESKLAKGQLPACVDACPTKALVFGDLNDPNSQITQLLRAKHSYRDKIELGTKPKLFKIPEAKGGII